MQMERPCRSTNRRFNCSHCYEIIPPSQRGQGPIEDLLCSECSRQKKSYCSSVNLTVKDSSSDDDDVRLVQNLNGINNEKSIIKELLDAAPHKIQEIWREYGRIEVGTSCLEKSKRKSNNPKRFVAKTE